MTEKNRYRRRRMRTFKINEISGVDVPAQEGARMLLMKRADATKKADTDVKKAGDLVNALTSETDGHQHGVHVYSQDGELGITVMYALAEGADASHDHPIVRNTDGSFTLGVVAGHTHELDADAIQAALINLIAKDESGDTTMTEKTNAEVIAELQKKLDRSDSIIALAAVEKAHFDALDDAGKDGFLAKSTDDRTKDIDALAKAAHDADPVVYTTTDGVDLRKSAGEPAIAMAKKNDDLEKRLKASEDKTATAELNKRAETELSNVSGDLETRSALLKAVDGIENEDIRKGAQDILKSVNDLAAGIFSKRGHGGTPVEVTGQDGAEDELTAKAKEIQKRDSVDYITAYNKAGEENPEIYEAAMYGAN